MNTTRYFKGALSLWKFESGTPPQIRTEISLDWKDSIFKSLADFLADPEPVLEVTAAEAEGERFRKRGEWEPQPPSNGGQGGG